MSVLCLHRGRARFVLELDSELRNVVLGSVRRGVLAQEHAFSLLGEATAVVATPRDVDGREVFAMAVASGCSAYDCEFAWLARALGVPLVTADRRLYEAFRGTAVSMDDFHVDPE